jgi:hypothetical protein
VTDIKLILDYYGGDYSLPGGQSEFAIPLSLNDLPGRWQVTAREPFSHQTAQIDFQVSNTEWALPNMGPRNVFPPMSANVKEKMK